MTTTCLVLLGTSTVSADGSTTVRNNLGTAVGVSGLDGFAVAVGFVGRTETVGRGAAGLAVALGATATGPELAVVTAATEVGDGSRVVDFGATARLSGVAVDGAGDAVATAVGAASGETVEHAALSDKRSHRVANTSLVRCIVDAALILVVGVPLLSTWKNKRSERLLQMRCAKAHSAGRGPLRRWYDQDKRRRSSCGEISPVGQR